jgi:hypothetical protein
MNERIKELANKAVGKRSCYMIEAEYIKFAELIVQECAQVMKAEGEQFSLDQNFDAVKGVGRCMRRIREHFGVKE